MVGQKRNGTDAANGQGNPDPGAQPAVADPEKTVTETEKPLRLADVRDATLAKMQAATQDPDRNRSKPFCLRVTAHSAADCGDLATAKSVMDQLPAEKGGLAYYRVPPLTSIAWQEWERTNREAAGKALTDAVGYAGELPNVGRFSTDTAGWLAARLVAADRFPEAQSLVDQFPGTGSAGELSAAMSTARAWDTYDVEKAEQARPLRSVEALQAPVVVEIVVAEGAPAQALQFAAAIPDPLLRTECQITWAEAITRSQLEAQPPNASAIDALLKQLNSAEQARLHARMGTAWLARRETKSANTALQSARKAFGTVRTRDEFAMPSMKDLATASPPDPIPARLEALALAEIARLEAGLDKKDDAWKDVSAALRILRSTAPTPALARELMNDLEQRGASDTRSQLRRLLNLRNDELAQVAANRYRQNCKLLFAASDARFALETRLLQAAIPWGHAADLWAEVSQRAAEVNADRAEPFLATSIPWRLADYFDGTGNKELATKIRQASEATNPSAKTLVEEFAVRVESTDPHSLAKTMQSVPDADPVDRLRGVLIAAGRLAHRGKIDEAIQFVRLFEDQLVREDALEWTIALATRLGFERPVHNLLHTATFVPTEAVSAYRGFLVGLIARQRAENSGPPAISPTKPVPAVPAKQL
jgi:hypothetical protein